VGAELVGGVAGRFELEGGVLDVEVPDEAGLNLVEQLRGVTVEEAGVVDDDVRGQGLAVGGDGPYVQVVHPADVVGLLQVGEHRGEVDAWLVRLRGAPGRSRGAAPRRRGA